MSWNDVKLSDVTPDTFEQLPAGTYTFKILTAQTRTNNFGTEELVIQAAISEGPNAGRRVFLQYPDPDSVNSKTGKKAKWSAQALKKLEIALGVDQNDGETVVEYFTRIAGNYPFGMELGPSARIRTGETEPRIEAKMFTVTPAA